MATYNYEEFATKVITKKTIYQDDLIKDEGFVYKAGEILASIRQLGYTEEQFNNMTPKKRAKVARASRKLLRRNHKLQHVGMEVNARTDSASHDYERMAMVRSGNVGTKQSTPSVETQIHEHLRGHGKGTIPTDIQERLVAGEHALWYGGKKKKVQEVLPSVLTTEGREELLKQRPIREDDLIIQDGMCCSALELHNAMEAAANTVIRAEPLSEGIVFTTAFRILRSKGQLRPKPEGLSDDSLILCGEGKDIKNCAFKADMTGTTTVRKADDDHMRQMRDWQASRVRPEEIKGAKDDPSFAERYSDAVKKITEWIILGTRNGYKLEKPSGSSVHHLADYSRRHGNGNFAKAIQPGNWMSDLQAFVVEHNWAAAFSNAKDFNSGEFRIPYPHCCFEFRISGMRCMFLFYGNEEGHLECPSIVVGCNEIWILLSHCFEVTPIGTIILQPTHEHPNPEDIQLADTAYMPLFAMAFKQIRAISIMLEAKVATKETIRAPERLNRQREKSGRTKLRDYHVVVLNRHRPRADRLPEELQTHGERSSPRLHFRSGHWRHFPSHRTWIEWQLIGNPDLGFVDKHYRL